MLKGSTAASRAGKVVFVAMGAILHIHLLGGLGLRHGEEPVATVNTPRLHSLLAYLLMHRERPQLRQHVAFVFWPDSSEAQARNNLRQILHELRHGLPDPQKLFRINQNIKPAK